MKNYKTIIIWFLVLAYLMGQWGCATGRYEYPNPEPLSEASRSQLGIIGVVSAPEMPDIHFERPLLTSPPGVLVRMGEGTVEGAGKSWNWWLDLCAKPFERKAVEKRVVGVVIFSMGLYLLPAILVGVCYVLTPPVTIVGGLGGGIGGAFPSFPDYPTYVEETEALIRDTLAKYPIQEKFQISFLKEARGRTSHTFLVGPGEEAETAEGVVGQGVDTVLELSAQRIGLKRAEDREGDLDPPMVLFLVIRARLLQGTEKTVWYNQPFVFETESRPYTLWRYTWPETTLVQEQIEEAYQKLAEEMVEKLFYQKQTDQISSPATSDPSGFSTETTLISQP